ncbi:hypothetical protein METBISCDRAFT_24355 [Metschnikowia bicuspidata]|uniref:Uncharacterized protein n=1 Tax=Metschnikowia bicuspidata TaxID=27322 RepID=A0A4V1J2P7_9ASCO|nr:hypothetical protein METBISCDRAFT_24355 [Metschnikowia bicuspidata]
MEKTDSVLNLTKPSLYSIYNTSKVDLILENDLVDEYLDGLELHIKIKNNAWTNTKPGASSPLASCSDDEPDKKPNSVVGIVGRLVTVGLAAWAYNEVTRNIYSTHSNGRGADITGYLMRFLHSLQPFQELVDRYGFRLYGIAHADFAFAMVLEGVLLSVVVPLLDKVMPAGCTKRVLSSNPNPYKRGNLANDVVRSLIAFLGISYAIRNVEWKTSLQMALTWSLINPGLWLLLDGTISGFVASILVAMAGSGLIYVQNSLTTSTSIESLPTIFLFIGSFFFCGVIIFGKLGRVLLQ